MTDRFEIIRAAAQSAYDEWYDKANKQAYVSGAILNGAERAAAAIEARVRAELADAVRAEIDRQRDIYPDESRIVGMEDVLRIVVAGSSPDTTPEERGDAWRLEEWNRLPDQCLIAACESHEIDERGPVWLTDGSMWKACAEHWEAITRILGDQASWERIDGCSYDTTSEGL